MKPSSIVFSILLATTVGLCACCHTESIRCSSFQSLGFVLQGFGARDIDTVQITYLKRNTTPGQIISSYRVDRQDISDYAGGYIVYVTVSDRTEVEVLLPSAGRSYRIANLQRDKDSVRQVRVCPGSKVDLTCFVGYTDYTLNGTSGAIDPNKQRITLIK